MEQVELAIIGAGAVGLAVARAMALRGQESFVLEQHQQIGFETSSRNSEVIHAGIYYPTGSLKAQLCVRGKDLLYEYCAQQEIPHRRCGKLIVACDASEHSQLNTIEARAIANGVTDLQWLDGSAVHEREPELRAHSALWSPSTGIIDSHAFMQSCQFEAERLGTMCLLDTRVVGLAHTGKEFIVQAVTAGEEYEFACHQLINCAGLHAQTLASQLGGYDTNLIPELHYCKGHYFSLSGARPFNHLIYPVPERNTTGLGIHATLTLDGQVRFGPDTRYVDELDYSVPADLAETYYRTIRRYYPGLADHSLQADYSGIRPKLQGPGEPFADFCLQGPESHGVPGLLHCFGIESPGLTAAMAIAEQLVQRLDPNP
ncbi:NAD(P)/FAD-dependent oxidoreductase [Aestuariirhabdus sp. Z084]|uniref:NAD(P)/FAD-dependent oxidoreductase n=1 Tax=Aestuariirhabdus haliotis TaxID=2918751 RepID=UPI00201B3824|nr:NAD(P)/FAD-dependent oxidoreductase [Aestuariirhabdus haliotis]MCL6416099.1 NAD(P)/FAD-dependent oxidoreductase [Aestuariirhabdus haliotis]MCL6420144.1 NAD(P)/FAD-dependent oxidoreductase [Aestuariirhabdus haliotis]